MKRKVLYKIGHFLMALGFEIIKAGDPGFIKITFWREGKEADEHWKKLCEGDLS